MKDWTGLVAGVLFRYSVLGTSFTGKVVRELTPVSKGTRLVLVEIEMGIDMTLELDLNDGSVIFSLKDVSAEIGLSAEEFSSLDYDSKVEYRGKLFIPDDLGDVVYLQGPNGLRMEICVRECVYATLSTPLDASGLIVA